MPLVQYCSKKQEGTRTRTGPQDHRNTPTDERGTTASQSERDRDGTRDTNNPTGYHGTVNQTERDRDGTGDTNHPTGRAPQATDGQLSRTDTQRVRTHTGRATHS